MQKLYQKYVDILKNIVTNSNQTVQLDSDEVEQIYALANKHYLVPFIHSYFKDTPYYQATLQQTKSMYLAYYQMDAFMDHTCKLLKQENIRYFVMKGLSLAQYYPIPQTRKMGDLDIYIPDSNDFEKAKKILLQNNYIEDKDLSDHHIGFFYTAQSGKQFELELHYKVIGTYQYEPCNKIVEKIYSHVNGTTQMINDTLYPVFSETAYTFYLLHHMLKHYLYSGFGIRLLLDFTFYIQKNKSKIDFNLICQWCKSSHIYHFYTICIACCTNYLGLDLDIEMDSNSCEEFLIKIIEENDMGSNVSTSLVGSGSYKKINLWTYFKEGHTQMKVRFPKACKIILLWPILWLITFICFIYNTYTLRNTSFRQTLKDFKKANDDSKLIRIFENSED